MHSPHRPADGPGDLAASGELDADYSQVELHPGEGGHVGLGDIGLAREDPSGERAYAILTTARQFGPAPFQVCVSATEPPRETAWDVAVEFSIRTGEGMTVTGWASMGDPIDVPVPAGIDVRGRYVVIGGQDATDAAAVGLEPDGDRYLLQVWPAPPAPPRVVTSTAAWAQYWTFGPAAEELAESLTDTADPAQLTHVLDHALRDHPDTAASIRSGDTRYRSGIIRYAHALFQVTYASGVHEALSADPDALGALIDARAAALR